MRGIACLLIVVGTLSSSDRARADAGNGRPLPISRRTFDPATRPGTAAVPSRGEKQSASSWTSTVSALAVVILLIFGVAKVLRPRGSSAPVTLPPEAIDVLGRKTLDYRHSIHLVRCGRRLLVLGSSQEGLSTLAEVTDPEEVESLIEVCKGVEPEPLADTFGQLVRRFRSEPESEPESTSEEEADPAILRLKQRLSPMSHASDSPDETPSTQETLG